MDKARAYCIAHTNKGSVHRVEILHKYKTLVVYITDIYNKT